MMALRLARAILGVMPLSAAERMRRSRARRRQRDAALAAELSRAGSGLEPAQALRAAAIEALAEGRPGAVERLAPVARLLHDCERLDRQRRANLVEGARLIPAETVERWNAACEAFGKRLMALTKTLPVQLMAAPNEAAVERTLTREFEAALTGMQTALDAITTGGPVATDAVGNRKAAA